MNDADPRAQRVDPWVHVVLALVLCLLAANLFMLFRYGYFSRLDAYSNLVVTLIVLFNHIASYGIYILWVSR